MPFGKSNWIPQMKEISKKKKKKKKETIGDTNHH